MLSYEIAKRAIEFSNPERVPVEGFSIFGFNDFYEVMCIPEEEPGFSWRGEGEKRDEWGCVWQRLPKDSGIINEGVVIGNPLTKASLNELEKYPFPDSGEKGRYDNLEKDLAAKEAKGKYVWFGDFYTLFERCWTLRGMQQVFIDLYDDKKFLHELLERITDFHIGVLENIRPYCGQIHGYHIGDDWGSQNGVFIKPEFFREFFKPRYERIIDYAHSLGLNVRLHSDGKISEFISEFIDIGLDVIELNSPRMLGIEAVSKRFRGQIAFEVCVDIQKTLPRGKKEEIETEVKQLIEKWGTEKGGIIALNYPDWDAIGVSQEKVKIALDAFLKYGKYQRKC